MFQDAGMVEYVAAWDLQREIHQRVADGDQDDTVLLLGTTVSPPASAPSRTSGRPTRVARRSSMSTGAARSPSTGPASWSATRS